MDGTERSPRSALSRLYGLPRRRGSATRPAMPRAWRWRGKAVSAVAVLLLLGAIGLLGYPTATDWYGHHVQSSLRSQLGAPSFAVTYQKHQVSIGQGLTRLRAPAMGLDVVVVEGTTTSALRAGAGHYPGTALPCETGNVAIAGHRTTYGHPFENLAEMGPGDEIELTTPFTDCWYKAVPDSAFPPTNPHPVDPSDTDVLLTSATPGATRPASTLTLTTCDPKGSAAHRLILRAVLEPQKTKVLHPLLPGSTGTAS